MDARKKKKVHLKEGIRYQVAIEANDNQEFDTEEAVAALLFLERRNRFTSMIP